MKSGKTSKLLYVIDGYIYSGKKVLYINSTLDTRSSFNGNDSVSSHRTLYIAGGRGFDQTKTKNLVDVNVEGYEAVVIDECQFFPDLITFCLILMRSGKEVIVGGLDLDYRGEPFGQTLSLLRYATKARKLYGCCEICEREGLRAGRNSTHTRRKCDGDLVLIDDAKYEACCFFHFENT